MDSYTETTTESFGSRLVGSCFGILIGIALFAGSFALIFWNEGRMDMARLAKNAAVIDPSGAADYSSLNGKLVALTGTLESVEAVGDGLYLNPGKYIAVAREVKMFAWVETKKESKKNNVGGSETTTTTYEYEKKWTDDPKDSAAFKHPEGHSNPPPAVEKTELRVQNAKIGAFGLEMQAVGLPALKKMKLDEQNVTLKNGASLVSSTQIFKGAGSYQTPRIGDLLISYSTLHSGVSVTAMGKLEGAKIVSYSDPKYGTLYRAFSGTKDDAVKTLHSEYLLIKWLIRGGGFLMMWIGLSLALAPITVVMDILPIAGALGRAFIGFVTFTISLVISTMAIIVSMAAHGIFALSVVFALGLVISVAAVLKMKNKAAAAKKAASS